MGGLFGGGGGGAPQKTAAQLTAEQNAASAQSRAEERATSSETAEMKGVQNRRRLRRVGGQRMLFSPFRTEGPNQPSSNKLGGGT